MGRQSSFTRTAGMILGMMTFAGAALAGPQEDADALLAGQDWRAAASAYEALLDSDEANANNWFSLGQARHQLLDYAGARDAYRTALSKGFQPAGRARFHLARALMSLGDKEGALTALEELAASGSGPTHRVLLATAEFAALLSEPRFVAVVAALTPCNTKEYRDFDFWIGDWDVKPAGSTAIAHNKISSVQEGCAVLEEYTNGAFTGMSLNFYDSVTGKWNQSWMSNAGGAVYLEGGLNDAGAMVMTDENLGVSKVSGSINRVTWTPNANGLRQYWEVSADGGKTWSVAFDGTYTPRKAD